MSESIAGSYATLAGVEIVNDSRTFAYLKNGLAPSSVSIYGDCGCPNIQDLLNCATPTDYPTINGLNLAGAPGSYAYAINTAALTVIGDIYIGAKFAAADLTPATNQVLVSKWNSYGDQRAYSLQINTAGGLTLAWSPDGTTIITKSSTVALPFTDGTTIYVYATLDVDNGAAGNDVRFFYSTGGVTYLPLGVIVTTAGTTNIFNGNADVELGAQSGGLNLPFSGIIYNAVIRNGIPSVGAIVGSPNFQPGNPAITTASSSITDSQGNVWTINNHAAAIRLPGTTGNYVSTPSSQAISAGANILTANQASLETDTTGWRNELNANFTRAPLGTLRLPGVTGNYVATPDSNQASVVGDLDIRLKLSLDTWTPSIEIYPIGKWDGTTNGYILGIGTGGNAGKLILYHSTTGSDTIGSYSTVATGLADGATKWIRATLALATGTKSYFLSDDGITWTPLGTPIVSGATTIFNSGAELEVGTVNAGVSGFFPGYVYYAEVRDGIGGPVVAALDAAAVTVTQPRSPASTTQGNANLLTANQSDIETDATGWVAQTNCTIVRSTTAGTFLDGVASLKLTATAAGDMGTWSTNFAVTPGQQYTAMLHTKAATIARQVSCIIVWLDAGGSYLGQASGLNAANTTTGWKTYSVSGIAIPGAVKAAVVFYVLVPAINEVHYIDRIFMWQNTNLLTANQTSIETDASGWTALGFCTIAQSAAQALDGTKSLAITSTAVNYNQVATAGVSTVVPGVQYTATAFSRAAATPRPMQIQIVWQNAGGFYLSGSVGVDVNDTTSGWTATTVTAIAPVGAVQAYLTVAVDTATAIGEVHYLDRISLVATAQSIQAAWTLNGSLWSWVQVLAGGASLAVSSIASGLMAVGTTVAASPVVGGKTYTFIANVRAASTAQNIVPYIRWYDSVGAFISAVNGTNIADATTGWTNYVFAATAPSNAAFANVQLNISTSAAAETHYVDRILFVRGTGDIDLRMKVSLDNWTTAVVYQTLFGGYGGNQTRYHLDVTPTGGFLRLLWTTNGADTTLVVTQSTVAVPFAAGAIGWIRATLDVDNGASGNTVTFYTSIDGDTWTPLGTPVITAGVTSVFGGTNPLAIGEDVSDSGNNLLKGYVYYADVRNGIGSTGEVVAKFDPNGSVIPTAIRTPSSFVSVTGETWTETGSLWSWLSAITSFLAGIVSLDVFTPYSDPATDNAPWYSPDIAASADFAGLIVSSFDGMDSPYKRNVSENIGNGAVLNRSRLTSRKLHWKGFLFGKTCCSVQYGLRWLAKQLSGFNASCKDCFGDDLELLVCCPEEDDTASPFRTLKGVGLIEGPTVVSERKTCTSGCSTGCGGSCILEVEFTLVASQPYFYAPEIPVYDCVSLADGGGIPYTDATTDCGPVNCSDVFFATGLCAQPALPPTAAYINSCVPAFITDNANYFTVSRSLWNDLEEVVPVISIQTGALPVGRIQLGFYSSDSDAPCSDLTLYPPSCSVLCDTLNIVSIPSNSTFYIDGRTRKMTLICPDGSAFPGERMTGGPWSWPSFDCQGFCMEARYEGDYATLPYAKTVCVSISLVPRTF